jgi:hypothetical protein
VRFCLEKNSSQKVVQGTGPKFKLQYSKKKEKESESLSLWHNPVIPTLWRLSLEDHELKVSLGYQERH